jgi:hypothetical protein
MREEKKKPLPLIDLIPLIFESVIRAIRSIRGRGLIRLITNLTPGMPSPLSYSVQGALVTCVT